MSKDLKKPKSQYRYRDETNELSALLEVSRALSSERSIPKILDMILLKTVENTSCDGSSIYLIKRHSQDTLGGKRPPYKKVLIFQKSISGSLDFEKFGTRRYLELNEESIAGYVASSSETVNIRDCYIANEEVPYQFNDGFDKEFNYRTKSMLAVPIKTAKGRVLGVLQLINKLKGRDLVDGRIPEKNIISFSKHDERLMEAFAGQAAVALENAKLTEDISNLFESFVKASVTAIEARDPATSGHSDRVAALTVNFAKALNRVETGPYSGIRFNPEQIREIRYAALLHDFGKIGVRENILLKAKKLYPNELENILLRLQEIKSKFEGQTWREVAENLAQNAEKYEGYDGKEKATHPQAMIGEALIKIDKFNREINDIKNMLHQANESQVVKDDFQIEKLIQWIEHATRKFDQLIISDEEKIRLSVARGTLTAEERREIESHVTHTFTFLNQIAWTEDLASVPEIAHAHHEKLNGCGYPLGLRANDIPVQSRLMTIADIYDALTAMDRPYKKSVDTDRALDILNQEAREGKLDTQLLKLFIEAKIYRVTSAPVSDGKRKKAA